MSVKINGKYSSATVFTTDNPQTALDKYARVQLENLCNNEVSSESTIRVMPDVHPGKVCTIGLTMTLGKTVMPQLLGLDIGCGVTVAKIAGVRKEWQRLDSVIRGSIPSGFERRKKAHRFTASLDLKKLDCYSHLQKDAVLLSLGTLGGGNHFIEADKDSDGSIYIVVHSGSRHLGVEAASYYQNEAYRRLNKCSDKEVQELIAKLKAEGKQKNIQSEIKKLTNTKHTNIPKALAYAEGELFDQYIHDMKIIQKFALLNRQAMMDEIIKGMKLHVTERFSTIHNYIDTENMILRKGAVSAQKGEKLLIPMNMKDGSFICIGKGNPDWNFSAPHGAGRLMSRAEAKETFTVSEFKKKMSGVYTTSVNQSTLDECPMAYKPIDEIVDHISDTVEIVSQIKPIYNFKAGTM